MEYQRGVVRPIESISEGWNNIKDNYWIFFSMNLVAGIILFAAALILSFIDNLVASGVMAILGVAGQNSGGVVSVSTAIVPQLVSMIFSVFTNLIVITISGVLFCGIYKSLSRQASGGTADFGDLFGEFQKIVPCFIVAVVLSLIQFIIGVIVILAAAVIGVSALGTGILTSDGQLNPAVFGGLFLVIIAIFVFYLIVSLIISALTTFSYPLIAERNLSGGQALLLSIKSGFANIGGLIGLLILLGLMAFGGMLLCCVGILFVSPILTASLYEAFQNVFGRANNTYQNMPPPPPTFGNQAGF